jgi:hypothetical protein
MTPPVDHDFKPGDKVAKPGYGYYGTVTKLVYKYRTHFVVVSWEGTIYTVEEYPRGIEHCPTRPERVNRYN